MAKNSSPASKLPLHKVLMRNIILPRSPATVLPMRTCELKPTSELFDDIVSDEVQHYHSSWDTTIINGRKYPDSFEQTYESRIKMQSQQSLSCLNASQNLNESQEIDFVSYLQETKSILALAQLLDSIEHGSNEYGIMGD